MNNYIPIIYANHSVESCPLYVKAPFELRLFKGQKESDTLEGDFIVGVNKYVQHDMFNEYVDVSQPLYHLVIKNDTNTIKWENYDGSTNIQYKEYSIYQDLEMRSEIGKLAIFMGGLFKENPYPWVSQCVNSYITRLSMENQNFQILNMVENTMDNPWVRVVITFFVEIDSLYSNLNNEK